MRKILYVLLCFIMIMNAFMAESVYADVKYAVCVLSEEVNSSEVAVSGSISPEVSEEVSLTIVVRDEEDNITMTENFSTDKNGDWKCIIPTGLVQTDKTFTYTISQMGDSAVVTHVDDFSGAKLYVASPDRTPADGEGNPAPSAQISASPRSRLLCSSSQAGIDGDMTSGRYAVSMDVMIPQGAYKSFMFLRGTYRDGRDIASINVVGESGTTDAYRIYSNVDSVDGKTYVYVDCADNNVLQTQKQTLKMFEVSDGIRWYNVQTEFNLDTLELKLYVDGERVLEDESLYVFALNDYTSLVDTHFMGIPETGMVYADNFKAEVLPEAPSVDVLPCYGSYTLTGYGSAAEIGRTQLLDDNKIRISGAIDKETSTGLEYKVYDGDECVYTGKTETNDMGEYSFEYTAGEELLNKALTVRVQGLTSVDDGVVYYEDDFSGGLGGKVYEINTAATDDNAGNPVPSLSLSEAGQRLLYIASGADRSHGTVFVKLDFMKPEKSNSDQIYGIFDGNAGEVLKVYSDNKDISMRYVSDNGSVSLILADNYSVNRWYTLKMLLNMKTRIIEVYMDDVLAGTIKYADSVPNIKRIFDTRVQSWAVGHHYIDNVTCRYTEKELLPVSSADIIISVPDAMQVSKMLSDISDAGADEIENKLKNEYCFLGLDFTDCDKLDDKSNVYKYMESEAFASVSDINEKFDRAVAFYGLCEVDTNDKIGFLKANVDKLGADISDVDFDISNSADILDDTIRALSGPNELGSGILNLETVLAFAGVTNANAYSVLESYSEMLINDESGTNVRMNADYRDLSVKSKKEIAKALITFSPDSDDAKTALINYVDMLNEAIEDKSEAESKNKSDRKPSSGGSGGGGRAGSIVVENNKISETPDAAESIEIRQTYSDVSSGYWCFDEIEALSAAGIINGNGNGTFNPENPITREEFAKLLMSAAGYSKEVNLTFKDVIYDEWYYPGVSAAFECGVVMGESAEIFGVGKPVTRQDAAVMIYRLCGVVNKELDYSSEQYSYTDWNQISDYARDAVEALSLCRMISGFEDGSFMPQKGLSRAEAVKMLHNFLSI